MDFDGADMFPDPDQAAEPLGGFGASPAAAMRRTD